MNHFNYKGGQPRRGPNFKGVYPTKGGKWYAQIKVNGFATRLGTFDTKEQAALAYNDAARAAYGNQAVLNVVEWQRLNFPTAEQGLGE